MAVIPKLMTDAHHHLGDLFAEVKRGHIVRIDNGTRGTVVAFLVSPATLVALSNLEPWEIKVISEGREVHK